MSARPERRAAPEVDGGMVIAAYVVVAVAVIASVALAVVAL